MKRKITSFISSTLATITAAVTSAYLLSLPAYAATFNGTIEEGAQSAQGNGQAANLFGTAGIFTTITNVLLYLVGAVSVIMIIIGGIRYIVSGGNSANVTAAKNTILYAIVGIIVSILGYAIVNFVITSFSGGTSAGIGGAGTTGTGF